MSAPTLFDWDEPVLPVRRTDPPTSRAAARSVDVQKREAEVLAVLRVLVVATAGDIADELRQQANCVARRLTTLELKGKVRRGGVKTGPSGRACTAWRLT